jgi:hypothetical protein
MTGKTGLHPVEVIAEVQSMELDLNLDGSYKLLLEDGSTVRADFTDPQWAHIEGMHNRGRYSIKIVGQGDYTDGRLQRIVSIDLTKTRRIIPPEDPEMPTLLHRLAEIRKSMDWLNVPTDGAKNLHHYLYGRAKVGD